MLYLFHGTEKEKARRAINTTIAGLLKKKPDADLVRMNADTWDAVSFDEHIAAQGLFVRRSLIVLDGVFENKEAQGMVLSRAKEIAESDNIFLLLEATLTAAQRKKLEKYAEQVKVFGDTKQEAKDKRGWGASGTFNIFAFTDALAARKRRRAWLLYQEALADGITPEEIHPMLFWQVKNMLAALRSESAKDAGLKPFVYTKSKSAARNFTTAELEALADKLVAIPHNARRGFIDFGLVLERLLLSV